MKENVIIYEMKSLAVAEGAGIEGDVMVDVYETFFYHVLCKEKWKIWNKISFSLKPLRVRLNWMKWFCSGFSLSTVLSSISSFLHLPGKLLTSSNWYPANRWRPPNRLSAMVTVFESTLIVCSASLGILMWNHLERNATDVVCLSYYVLFCFVLLCYYCVSIRRNKWNKNDIKNEKYILKYN